MHLPNDPNPAPTAPYLWRVLREYITQTWRMLGAPIEIARRYWLTRQEARVMHDVLRPLEHMLRRLTFLDALNIKPPPAKPARKTKRPPRPDPFNLDTAETWRVSFDLRARSKSDRRLPAGSKQEPAGSRRSERLNIVSSAPIALRLEALIRGFNAPERLAQRLARLLARDRARQYAFLTPIRARDCAKPFFAQAEQTGALTRDAWQLWLTTQLQPRASPA